MRDVAWVLHSGMPARKQRLLGREVQARSTSARMLSPREPRGLNERSPGFDSLQVGPPLAGGMSHSWEVSPDADRLVMPWSGDKRMLEVMGGALRGQIKTHTPEEGERQPDCPYLFIFITDGLLGVPDMSSGWY